MDFIYERNKTPHGIKIETVSGGSRYKGKVWREIARQIYCENGKEDYREIGHFSSGAPFLFNSDEHISISHTEGCMVVATVRMNPDAEKGEFDPAAALGVDVERADRKKALELRERFLTAPELSIVSADSVEENITAWSCKEAMLKAFMDPAIDWLNNITIKKLPSSGNEGRGIVKSGEDIFEFRLYSYRYEDFIITLAFS